MSELKKKIIDEIIEVEGGYVNNPDDSGGPTRYGITERVARAYGYTGDMRELPYGLAFDVYVEKYWNPLSLDVIEAISPTIAAEIADTGINMGIERAAIFLQRSLNVLNQKSQLYPDLVVDGKLGPASMRALSDYLSHRVHAGEIVLLRMLNSLQGAFYIELAERREKDETFIYGWFRHRVII